MAWRRGWGVTQAGEPHLSRVLTTWRCWWGGTTHRSAWPRPELGRMFHCCQISLLRKDLNTPHTRTACPPRFGLWPLFSKWLFPGNPTCFFFALVTFLIGVPYLLTLLPPSVYRSGFNFCRASPSFQPLWSPCTLLPLTSPSDLLLRFHPVTPTLAYACSSLSLFHTLCLSLNLPCLFAPSHHLSSSAEEHHLFDASPFLLLPILFPLFTLHFSCRWIHLDAQRSQLYSLPLTCEFLL